VFCCCYRRWAWGRQRRESQTEPDKSASIATATGLHSEEVTEKKRGKTVRLRGRGLLAMSRKSERKSSGNSAKRSPNVIAH
jgi:hypothetical protein